ARRGGGVLDPVRSPGEGARRVAALPRRRGARGGAGLTGTNPGGAVPPPHARAASRDNGAMALSNGSSGGELRVAVVGSGPAGVYAVGAQTDRRSGIPGEDLPGSWAATDFVGWYNGHPDYRDLVFDLSCERAIVVGNGNVAMDVARMLCLTREELAVTDVGDH